MSPYFLALVLVLLFYFNCFCESCKLQCIVVMPNLCKFCLKLNGNVGNERIHDIQQLQTTTALCAASAGCAHCHTAQSAEDGGGVADLLHGELKTWTHSLDYSVHCTLQFIKQFQTMLTRH